MPHIWCCAAALLDIPVYKSRVQSLHVLFSLYAAFTNSQVRYLPCFCMLMCVIGRAGND